MTAGYRIWIPETNKVENCKFVTFQENETYKSDQGEDQNMRSPFDFMPDEEAQNDRPVNQDRDETNQSQLMRRPLRQRCDTPGSIASTPESAIHQDRQPQQQSTTLRQIDFRRINDGGCPQAIYYHPEGQPEIKLKSVAEAKDWCETNDYQFTPSVCFFRKKN
ncbi:hypothetical protein CHUAL_009675 [Chamberlinius hualienensis]